MTGNRREFRWGTHEPPATAHQDRTEIKSGEPVLNRDNAKEPDGRQLRRLLGGRGVQPCERRAAERRYEFPPSNMIVI
jgi:hypothetical protein